MQNRSTYRSSDLTSVKAVIETHLKGKTKDTKIILRLSLNEGGLTVPSKKQLLAPLPMASKKQLFDALEAIDEEATLDSTDLSGGGFEALSNGQKGYLRRQVGKMATHEPRYRVHWRDLGELYGSRRYALSVMVLPARITTEWKRWCRHMDAAWKAHNAAVREKHKAHMADLAHDDTVGGAE